MSRRNLNRSENDAVGLRQRPNCRNSDGAARAGEAARTKTSLTHTVSRTRCWKAEVVLKLRTKKIWTSSGLLN